MKPVYHCQTCRAILPDRVGGRKFCRECIAKREAGRKKYETRRTRIGDQQKRIERGYGDWLDRGGYVG